MINAERVRLRRHKCRLSQRALGEAIGIDQAYVSRLEKGLMRNITTDTLERLADTLGVTTDYLLGRTDEPDTDLRRQPAAVA